jgi:hypothetical protein
MANPLHQDRVWGAESALQIPAGVYTDVVSFALADIGALDQSKPVRTLLPYHSLE